MAVFRIDKTKDYTVMANFHLRDKSLSLKAKGLLSLMLSLPEDWDYTTKGLAYICKDGVDSICAAVKELENAGYVQRKRNRNSQGRLTNVEYTILEKPISTPEVPQAAKRDKSPKRENPVLDNPVLVSPVLDSPKLVSPELENPAQLNTYTSSKEKINTDLSNTHSFFPSAEETCNSGRTERMITSGDIRAQIEYEIMVQRYRRDQLDELVEIMLEVALNQSPTIHIGRDAEYPTRFVQERFRKINALHIEKVMDGIAENRTRVYNTKAYLMAALFNSVSTIEHHYTMQYNAEADDYGSL
jgi:hypothetical protein